MSDTQDNLYTLIRSLTPAEKRYFSIFASRHTIGKENNSLRMFKKLEGIKSYDEKKFLSRYKSEGFAKHYGFNKHFLYELILQSLHSFHSGKTIENELQQQLHHIDILMEKGLTKQARSIVRTALKKAEKYDLHTVILELLNRDMTLNREEGFAGRTEEDVKQLTKRIAEEVHKISMRSELENITAFIAIQANKSGLLRNKNTLDKLKKLQKDKKLEKAPESYYAAWHFHSARMGLHHMMIDHEKALKENDALLSMMEQNPHMIKENPRYYILSLNNKMVLLGNFRRYEEMLQVSDRIGNVPVKSQVLRNRKFNISNGLLLQMYVKTGEFEKGLELLKESNRKLAAGEVQFLDLQYEIAHYFAAANLYFGVGNYTEANKYLGEIVSRRDLILRDDILCFSLLMRIIVQFEMKKQDLLEYTVRSAYRFLYKRNRLYKFEGMVLDFIRKKSPHLDTQKKLVAALEELHDELMPLTKDPLEKNAFAYFDIISWIESKMYNKTFQEMVIRNIPKNKGQQKSPRD